MIIKKNLTLYVQIYEVMLFLAPVQGFDQGMQCKTKLNEKAQHTWCM